MKKIALASFVVFSILQLASGFLGNSLLHFFSKPMILISLGAYYIVSAQGERSATVVGAIFFSLAGDIFLLWPSYFIPGLVAFLVAHFLYIFSYRQHREEGGPEGIQGIQKLRLAFPVVLAGTGLLIILYPNLGELRIPVIVYTLVITVMVLNGLFRLGRTNPESFWMVLGGAMFFMVSDSLLAVNKFLLPVSNSNFWIMSTYIIAQFLIVEGLLRHHLSVVSSKQY
jgi:uncharacterized membrane protein YhhN